MHCNADCDLLCGWLASAALLMLSATRGAGGVEARSVLDIVGESGARDAGTVVAVAGLRSAPQRSRPLPRCSPAPRRSAPALHEGLLPSSAALLSACRQAASLPAVLQVCEAPEVLKTGPESTVHTRGMT